MNKFLIDNYYDKLLFYTAKTDNYNFIKYNRSEVRRLLSMIIENNLDFLLNDSFLMYIAESDTLYDELMAFTENDYYEHIRYLCFYFNSILENYYKYKGNKNKYSLFLDYIDDETKKDTLYANMYCDYIENNINIENQEFYTLYKMTLIILSYCHINKIMDEFIDIYDSFIKNYSKALDDISINNINDRTWCDSNFIDRVIRLLDNKKIIR